MTTSGAVRGCPSRMLIKLLIALCAGTSSLVGLVVLAPESAFASKPTSHLDGGDASVSRSLRSADRTLTQSRAALRRCRHVHHAGCLSQRRAFERARRRLRNTQFEATAQRAPGRTTYESNDRSAPTITVVGQTLSWTKVANVSTYVLLTKAPGSTGKESLVQGTSVTPAAVPGAAVHYSVRTDVTGSSWASEVSISYPSASTEGESHGNPSEPLPTAPVGGEGTITPPAKEESTSSDSTGSSALGSPGTSFKMGLNSGWEQLDFAGASKLDAQLVRLDCRIELSVKELEFAISEYAARGIRVLPLADFHDAVPTAADAQNLAAWAKAFGPGGTFWKSWKGEALPIEDIEFGNETDNGYQYGYQVGSPEYTALAETYAHRFKETSEALAKTGTGVGLLAQEQDPTGHWIADLYNAVPNFAQYVAGWTIHPYGPEWRSSVGDLIKQTAAYGASATIPIDITEWGLSSDNGSCLTSNFNWNPCMSYQEASEVLRTAVSEMSQAFGSRIGVLMIYQVRDQEPVNTTNNVEAYFGALQHELQPKGAYTSEVQSLLSTH